jgi:hypothetical protein
MLPSQTEGAVEQRARRIARSVGLVARKTRWRKDSIDNQGGFQLVDPNWNTVVDGARFDLTAEEVIQWCESKEG